MSKIPYFLTSLLLLLGVSSPWAAPSTGTTPAEKATAIAASQNTAFPTSTPAQTSSATQKKKTATSATSKKTGTIKDPENLSLDKIPDPEPMSEGDPLGPINRGIYRFNDFLDKAILKPTATLYNKIMPKPLHRNVTNFFNNIDNIPTVINDILQTNFYQACSDGWRLFINSTLGIFGLFDVATSIGLEQNHEDFGLTLAYWGYKDSTYIVVPFFGPGTIRDVIGWPIDYFFFSVYPYIKRPVVRYSVYGACVVNSRANLLEYQNVFEQAALDKYGFIRNAYQQHRKYLIDRNKELADPNLEEKTNKT